MYFSGASIRGKKQKITFDNFEFLKVLGKGGFGKVILCREKSSNSLYAMKILKKKFIKSKGCKTIERTHCEKRVLQTSKHPFVLSLKYSFTTQERLCLGGNKSQVKFGDFVIYGFWGEGHIVGRVQV